MVSFTEPLYPQEADGPQDEGRSEVDRCGRAVSKMPGEKIYVKYAASPGNPHLNRDDGSRQYICK
ncbi:hypothetical protein [Bradyrhizobium arachidis]|uniref:hypothetical protein n=1 Tax=Bradyrhizobium arachidis TaxID=858423 RepID=UPI0021631E56|nr:hypothetical protein [Bradyrhizobium arachidis]UVO27051.1 hypothetical protein KUF59_31635 [Bradyrhizobium arachidis]